MTVTDVHARRAEHLDLLKRALELESLDAFSRAAFEDMLEDLSVEEDRRCAHGPPRWKQATLTAKQERWVRAKLGEEPPEPDTRLSAADVPRGREVAPMWDAGNLPKRPPGRSA